MEYLQVLKSNVVQVWDPRIGVCVSTLVGHKEALTTLQLDSQIIVSGSLDGQIR